MVLILRVRDWEQTPISVGLIGFTKPSNLCLDILMGNDETIEIADVLTGEHLRSLSLFVMRSLVLTCRDDG